jgi:hypothetical protein
MAGGFQAVGLSHSPGRNERLKRAAAFSDVVLASLAGAEGASQNAVVDHALVDACPEMHDKVSDCRDDSDDRLLERWQARYASILQGMGERHKKVAESSDNVCFLPVPDSAPGLRLAMEAMVEVLWPGSCRVAWHSLRGDACSGAAERSHTGGAP